MPLKLLHKSLCLDDDETGESVDSFSENPKQVKDVKEADVSTVLPHQQVRRTTDGVSSWSAKDCEMLPEPPLIERAEKPQRDISTPQDPGDRSSIGDVCDSTTYSEFPYRKSTRRAVSHLGYDYEVEEQACYHDFT